MMKQIKMPVKEPIRYKGYFYIRCPYCGEEKSFYSSSELDGYFCKSCGKWHPFKKLLVPVFINCECRGFSKYMTNVTEEMLDVSCIRCGMPVAVKWNRKKRWYEKIR